MAAEKSPAPKGKSPRGRSLSRASLGGPLSGPPGKRSIAIRPTRPAGVRFFPQNSAKRVRSATFFALRTLCKSLNLNGFGLQASSIRFNRSISSSMAVSPARSSSIFRTAYITVVWSRPPNLRPISGSDRGPRPHPRQRSRLSPYQDRLQSASSCRPKLAAKHLKVWGWCCAAQQHFEHG